MEYTDISTRYSMLRHLTPAEQREICVMILNFFNPLNNVKHRQSLELPIIEGSNSPLSLNNFFVWAEKVHSKDLYKMQQRVIELVLILENKGVLTSAGREDTRSLYSNCYHFIYELSSIQQKGPLWLGEVLGASYISYYIKHNLVQITGRKSNNDVAAGTGFLILPGIILTCAHVIDDMDIDEYIHANFKKNKVKSKVSDPTVDIGIIYLEEAIEPILKDMAFRSARELEEVVIAGFPSIPLGISPTITVNRGEICGSTETYYNQLFTLFSAIAHPGNSGGPVVGLDGRIVGIVTRSLERQREEVDPMEPLPFFAAVPSEVIRESFRNLSEGKEIPWEDYK